MILLAVEKWLPDVNLELLFGIMDVGGIRVWEKLPVTLVDIGECFIGSIHGVVGVIVKRTEDTEFDGGGGGKTCETCGIWASTDHLSWAACFLGTRLLRWRCPIDLYGRYSRFGSFSRRNRRNRDGVLYTSETCFRHARFEVEGLLELRSWLGCILD